MAEVNDQNQANTMTLSQATEHFNNYIQAACDELIVCAKKLSDQE